MKRTLLILAVLSAGCYGRGPLAPADPDRNCTPEFKMVDTATVNGTLTESTLLVMKICVTKA